MFKCMLILICSHMRTYKLKNRIVYTLYQSIHVFRDCICNKIIKYIHIYVINVCDMHVYVCMQVGVSICTCA